MSVEEDEDGVNVAVEHGVLPFDVRAGIEAVLNQQQEVRHRQPRQDGVGGVNHLSPRQYHHVQHVGEGPQQADHERQVPMHLLKKGWGRRNDVIYQCYWRVPVGKYRFFFFFIPVLI